MSMAITKISNRNVGLSNSALDEAVMECPEGGMAVMRVAGRLASVETDTSQYGEFKRFTGSFNAVNLLTGAEYFSSKLVLPGVSEEVLNTSWENYVEQEGDEAESITFAIDVTIIPVQDPSPGSSKYTWGCENLIESQVEDPMKKLMASLPAPKGH